MEKKKNRKATFVCSLSYKNINRKIISVEGRIEGKISTKIIGKKDLGMTQFLSLIKKHYLWSND